MREEIVRFPLNVALAVALAMACIQEAGSSESQMSDQGQAEDAYLRHMHAAIQINDLAGRIHSEADASAYVSAIADLFAKELPPHWAQHNILHRISRAEFDSVSNPPRLIPEQRIVDVWNQYMREIGAPDETFVNAAEIHNMRDGTFTVTQMMWSRGQQTAWTMPNAFAVGADGKVADGCRAVETIRVMHDLEQLFQNVSSARERLRNGIVPSNKYKNQSPGMNSHPAQSTFRAAVQTVPNPVRPAEQRYVQEHGAQEYQKLLTRLFDELFPPK
jgi:hypothetical protein